MFGMGQYYIHIVKKKIACGFPYIDWGLLKQPFFYRDKITSKEMFSYF